MLMLHFVSYSGLHTLRTALTAYPAAGPADRPQLILRDEQGYYGFIDDPAQIRELRDWCHKALGET